MNPEQSNRRRHSSTIVETVLSAASFTLLYGGTIHLLSWVGDMDIPFIVCAAFALIVYAVMQVHEKLSHVSAQRSAAAAARPRQPVPLRQRLTNLWLSHRPRLRRALFPLPRPDFLEADVLVVTMQPVSLYSDGSQRQDPDRRMAWFPAYPPDMAEHHGWVKNFLEYEFLANLTFAYRFPNHPFSREVRAEWPDVPDESIAALARGERAFSG